MDIMKPTTANNNLINMEKLVDKQVNIIETKNLGQIGYDIRRGFHIWSSIDLIIKSEKVLPLSENRFGQNDLISLLAGLDTPSTGTIILNGRSLTALDEDGRASVRNELIGSCFPSLFNYCRD